MEAQTVAAGSLMALVDAMSVAAAVVDRAGRLSAGNPRWKRLAEDTPAGGASLGLGHEWFASCGDPSLAGEMGEPWSRLGEVLSGARAECSFDLEIPQGGKLRWKRVVASGLSLGDFQGALLTVLDLRGGAGSATDQRRLAAIVEGSSDAILSKDLDGRIVSWNRAAEEIYGYSAEEMIGRSVTMLAPEDRPDEIPAILERLRRGERIDQLETVRCRKDGTRIDVELSISPIRDENGVVVGASAIARDVTERKELERRLTELATRDSLTGATSRARFLDLAEHEAARCIRGGGTMSVLMIDLDDFKAVNDRYGHSAGDAVLERFVRIARDQARGVDVVARLGGDEFAVLLPDTPLAGALHLAERLRASIARSVIETAERSLTFTISVGAAEIDESRSVQSLLERADQALYEAKRLGRNGVAAAGRPA